VPSRRTQLVWGSFLAAMTLVVAMLSMGSEGMSPGYLMSSLGARGEARPDDPIFRLGAPLDRQRWTSIVIHHSGEPAGDAESIRRLHESYGYRGLGYHFLIGNGNGLGDGVVHVGYRWDEQLPGVHTGGPESDHYNQHAIGICLVGNGDRRPFTARQLANLVSLVQRLQRQLEIPARRVYLHRDLAEGVSSPGRYFASGALQEQLLDAPR
jgi:N-acetyl-anhydromuramyl-L-alanine amidase AmpD